MPMLTLRAGSFGSLRNPSFDALRDLFGHPLVSVDQREITRESRPTVAK
jgi:hypothetical protein